MEKILNKIEYTQIIILYILVFGTSLIISNGNLTAVEIKNIFVQIGIIIILAFIPMQISYKKALKCPRNPVPWLAGVYLLFLAIAYFRTDQTSINYQAFVPQFFGTLIFLVLILKSDKVSIRSILMTTLISAIFAVIYGFLQYFNIDSVEWDTNLSRGAVVSFFGNKNFFGLYLLLITPLATCGFFYFSHIFVRTCSLLLGIFSFIDIILSYSRGALVSFLVAAGLTIPLIYGSKKTQKNIPLLKRILLFTIIPAIAITTFFLMPAQIKSDFQNLFLNKEYTHRIICYKAALMLIAEKPFQGIGIGNFTSAARATSNPPLFFGDPNFLLTHVHNDYLEIWLEQGILSLLAFLSIVTIIFVKCVTIAQKTDDKNKYICTAVACSILGFSIYIFGTIGVGNLACNFYFWIILAAGYLTISNYENSGKFFFTIHLPDLKKFTAVIFLICTVTGTVLLIYDIKRFAADTDIKKAYDCANDGNYSTALVSLNQAINSDPKSIDALYQRGFILFSQKRYTDAITDFLTVEKYAPGYLNGYFNLASSFYRLKNFDSAIKYAEISYTNFPSYEPAAVLLAYCYFYKGALDDSKQICSSALMKFPDNQKLSILFSRINTVSLLNKE